jgi:hypothetical protein
VKDAGTCNGVELPGDTEICNDCYQMLTDLEIGSSLGPCACAYCGVQLMDCFASADRDPINGDWMRDRSCRAIIECAWSVGCAGADCYCGEDVDRDTCLKNANEGRFLGPCATVIQNSVQCTPDQLPGNCVFGEQLRFDSVLDRATEVAKCVSGDRLQQGEKIVPMCR